MSDYENYQGRKWFITETFKENGSEVAATPTNWVKSGVLFWPPDLSKKSLALKLENCVEPVKKWKSFYNFEILEDKKIYGKLKTTRKLIFALKLVYIFIQTLSWKHWKPRREF